MSYDAKNKIKDQLDFLDIILPLYGIKSLCDTDTEVSSKDLSKFDEMTDLMSDIKRLFKISIMNLSKGEYKITKTNAIPILKHLCIQANVPFDITKYSNYYTFSLARDNILLTLRRNKKSPIPLDQKFKEIINPKIDKILKPLETLDKLTCFEVKDTFGEIFNKHDIMKTESEIKNNVIELLDIESPGLGLIKVLVEHEDYQSVKARCVLAGIVNSYHRHDNSKCVAVHLDRSVDIYRDIISVKLYDVYGNMILDTDKVSMRANNRIILTNITSLNYPAFRNPFNRVDILIPYPTDGKTPYYYYITFIGQTIQNKYRNCNNYEKWAPFKKLGW